MKQRIIHIHPPKTGGSSLRSALKLLHQPRHLNALELREHYPEYDKAYSFSFVRNPFAVAVSQYEYSKRKGYNGIEDNSVSFDEWVQACYVERDPGELFHDERYYQTCLWWISDTEGRFIVDDVYRFESWPAEIKRLRRRLRDRGLEYEFSVPHLKRSPVKRHYRDYYQSAATRHAIETFFESDMEAFDYAF